MHLVFFFFKYIYWLSCKNQFYKPEIKKKVAVNKHWFTVKPSISESNHFYLRKRKDNKRWYKTVSLSEIVCNLFIFIWQQEQDYAPLNQNLALSQQSLLNIDVYCHI